jgi:hypothetical protein
MMVECFIVSAGKYSHSKNHSALIFRVKSRIVVDTEEEYGRIVQNTFNHVFTTDTAQHSRKPAYLLSISLHLS